MRPDSRAVATRSFSPAWSTGRGSTAGSPPGAKWPTAWDVVTRISETPVDAEDRAAERIVVRRVTIRDQPPPDIPPFTTETDVAARIEAAPTEAETPVDRVEIIDAEMTRR